MKQLSKEEMKRVMGGLYDGGGGGLNCCAHTKDWKDVQCGYTSQNEAHAAADQAATESGQRVFYCCDCGADRPIIT